MPPSARSLPNLDLLRSLAITLVVVDHVALSAGRRQLGPFAAGWIGVSGVFLFFVHTALVLLWSLERKPHTLDFYIRRVFRIYPLALAAIATAALTHAPVGGTVEQWFQRTPLNAKVLVSNAFLIQNLTGQPSVLNVLWSLPLEVQMYVLLPALFFLVRWAGHQPAYRHRVLALLLLLWGLVVWICAAAFPKTALNLMTAIPLFLPGVMAYVGFNRVRPRLPGWSLPLVLLLLLGVFWLRPSIHYGWALALLVGLLLPFCYQIRGVWAIRSSHAIAKYSYGVYLTHPFALVLGFPCLPGRPFALQLSIALLVTTAGSVAAYHAIEKPLIDLGAALAARLEARYERLL